jgi:hypothetical protein
MSNTTNTMETISTGNNESLSRGVIAETHGTFTALAFTRSKSGFKTRAGAERWLARATGAAQ